jgi:transposase
LIVGPGNEHDSKRFEQTVNSIRIKSCRGRPRNKTGEVLADAAYDTEAIRLFLGRRGIKSYIPGNKRNQKKLSRGRPTRFDGDSYRNRGSVERPFAWLKLGFRRIAQRHERLDECFLGLILLAGFVIIWNKIGVLR